MRTVQSHTRRIDCISNALMTYLEPLIWHRRFLWCRPYSVRCIGIVLRQVAAHRLSANCHRQRFAYVTLDYCCCWSCVASDFRCQRRRRHRCAFHRNPIRFHPAQMPKNFCSKSVGTNFRLAKNSHWPFSIAMSVRDSLLADHIPAMLSHQLRHVYPSVRIGNLHATLKLEREKLIEKFDERKKVWLIGNPMAAWPMGQRKNSWNEKQQWTETRDSRQSPKSTFFFFSIRASRKQLTEAFGFSRGTSVPFKKKV